MKVKNKIEKKNKNNNESFLFFLVFNVGSSSVKVKGFKVKKNNKNNKSKNKQDFVVLFEENFSNLKSFKDYDKVLKEFVSSNNFLDYDFSFFVHRIVHGFDYNKTSFFNKKVREKIVLGSNIAPLHNVPQLRVLDFFEKYKKNNKNNFRQIVVFDSFIYDFPFEQKVLPLNLKIAEKHKIFRVGFHGLNHFFMYNFFKKKYSLYNKKVVTVHLGSGSSVSGVFKDKFLFNSMSFSPTDGVFMSTRTGSLDPFIPLYLQKFYSKKKVEEIINFESGFLGFCGEKDFYTIFKNKDKKTVRGKKFSFVYNYFINSVVENILRTVNVLEGLDFIVFSGAIGFNKQVQKDIVKKLKNIGFNFSYDSVKANEEEVLLKESLKFLKL